MFKRFILYIEQEPWEEAVERQFKWIDRFCWLALILFAIYFIPSFINILTR